MNRFPKKIRFYPTFIRINPWQNPYVLFFPRPRHVVLRTLLHAHDLLQQVVEVFPAVDEVDVRGIDDEERRVGIAKEKLIIGLVHGGDVIGSDFFLEGPASLLYAPE